MYTWLHQQCQLRAESSNRCIEMESLSAGHIANSEQDLLTGVQRHDIMPQEGHPTDSPAAIGQLPAHMAATVAD